jgi:hypothetical protein
MILTRIKSFLMMISWRSKNVGVILSVLMYDIRINVLLQTSVLVGPLHMVIGGICFVINLFTSVNRTEYLFTILNSFPVFKVGFLDVFTLTNCCVNNHTHTNEEYPTCSLLERDCPCNVNAAWYNPEVTTSVPAWSLLAT